MLIKTRTEWLMKLVNFKNKDVLELGCCGMGKYDIYTHPSWFHKNIKKICKHITGLDYNEKMLNILKGLDYDVRKQNLNLDFDLKKKFDIVTANEILEHLTEPSKCLRNIKKHLKDDGLFVMTTPHVWSHFYFLQRLFRDKIDGVSLFDHKFWWDRETLTNLLKANGFKVLKVRYGYRTHSAWPILDTILFRPIAAIMPQRMGRNLCVICKKK